MKEITIKFRAATEADLPSIVQMLADDEIGQSREDPRLPLSSVYTDAFSSINADKNQLLAVAVAEGDTVVGTLQLSFVPGLARMGAWREQIEAVRIAASHRNSGLGQEMFEWAIEQCRNKNCMLVQLTTDKSRPDAHRFYESLGFEATHEGYKLKLL